jgi:hypothetical protein
MRNWSLILTVSLYITIITITVKVLIWRVIYIKREMGTLLCILAFTPFLLVLIFANVYNLDRIDICYVSFYSFAALSAYIQTYPALREDIPTIKILNLIFDNKEISVIELLSNPSLNKSLHDVKIEELINDKLLFKDGNILVLGRWGKFLAISFSKYRVIFDVDNETG